ncbi:peroxisome biosynthesis protein, pas10 [Grosmannia clavigera kw1407]|uniref:Peroxisome assembly protein 12 n=1 Tax=Grosmannia clavigera (strain kw1407 / UAMH 11150) TaxID=655863 RepID=F0XFK0_GROCL|nr:peroxisome biosynthesis protein, pas10 [Grosmannia clavigera kw1407]EFX04232.1 peroxisome biosynthesis protein, pas10 [Grosmannia clavigera kw1407]
MEFASGAAVDEQKPSLFELLSEQQLNGLLPPTLRYLLTVATQRYPRYLLRALNSFDELYAVAMLVVEHYYLRTRGGTFTEHFYGLKRERAVEGGDGTVLRAAAGAPSVVREVLQLGSSSAAKTAMSGDLWRNLAVLVGVPYIKRKLDEAYEVDAPRARLGVAYQQLPTNATMRERLRHAARWFLRNVYPSVHAAYGFATLAFQLAYLFDGTPYASPLLWLARTRVRRMTGADYRAIDEMESGKSATASASSASARLLSGLSLVLPTSIFALKFLEWWHASDFAKQLSLKAAASLDLPAPMATGLVAADGQRRSSSSGGGSASSSSSNGAGAAGRKGILKKESRLAPQDSSEHETEADDEEYLARTAPIAKPSLLPIFTVAVPTDSRLCPICGDTITTPTACQTGVVYCYICIHKWVSGQHDKQEAFVADKAGRWESGVGRCAVTGRRILGGTEGLRRLMV